MASTEAANRGASATAGQARAQKPNPNYGQARRPAQQNTGARTAAQQRRPAQGNQQRRQVQGTQQRRPSDSNPARKRKRRKKSRAPIILLAIVIFIVVLVAAVYFVGYNYYAKRFTANTYVNGTDVSGLSLEEAAKLFAHEEVPDTFQVVRPSGEVVNISLEAIDYSYNYEQEISKIFDDIDRKSWFACYFGKKEYSFTDASSYDTEKLMDQIDTADWGSEENVNAKLKSNDDGYYVVAEVQGDVFDMDGLKEYITQSLDNAVYTVNGVDSGAYIQPDKVASDYDKKLATLNKMWKVKLYYDFTYTKEKLTGKKLCSLINVKKDGSYTVDEEACEKYIEKLGKKYDTYNTERKFKATLQGNITIPTSDDAKYGWWLDQEQCTEQLIELLEKGKSNKKVEPIYYKSGNYEFTGMASARSADDDIGTTYIEIDLTAQHFWYYKKGKLVREGDIVSGQTTSEARTTLPGVYKVWFKDTNYEMKGSNSDGDTWDTTCNYWTRVAICGIGLHDSTWRSAWGGNIYTYDGSHGCINMTYDDAKFVYEKVAMDTPVVMYY